ncbi:ATP-grasp peptide maturase system methyltransferase [Streptomyces mutabilis]|uniref:ATP-grasp peptide maturase system methyltransferase n=1 Tax=Streptomyces mutabilis TaxID=67332 RepID=UPI001781A2A2|nr:ATP-grasp peptide maturase system methyltransferase [Streptomyces mutabilis]GGQ02453.1 SAM-dependent methyltransferase [Streptomyces mutabilis]
MTLPTDIENDATALRSEMAKTIAEAGTAIAPAWLTTTEKVPRHAFVPGFYLPGAEPDAHGLTVWEPITAQLDYGHWLASVYSDTALVTRIDGEETDWSNPVARHGGVPTSSSTLPSLVLRTWSDADVTEAHTVLEIGTGTGYSTALACELLGSSHVTSVEIDSDRLKTAADALYSCGYTPTLARADGLYGYWPEAWFDRAVATCSFRAVPPTLLQQVRPGGKVLLPLSGWLYGSARALLTVAEDGAAEGPLLPGTISFMSARTHTAPAFGNPADWAAGLTERPRPARHTPEQLTAATDEAFHLRFLVQSAVPDAQMVTLGGVLHLIDVTSGSAATLARDGDTWLVREGGPLKLWERAERLIDDFIAARRPGPESFTLRVDADGQRLLHPLMPHLTLRQG